MEVKEENTTLVTLFLKNNSSKRVSFYLLDALFSPTRPNLNIPDCISLSTEGSISYTQLLSLLRINPSLIHFTCSKKIDFTERTLNGDLYSGGPHYHKNVSSGLFILNQYCLFICSLKANEDLKIILSKPDKIIIPITYVSNPSGDNGAIIPAQTT